MLVYHVKSIMSCELCVGPAIMLLNLVVDYIRNQMLVYYVKYVVIKSGIIVVLRWFMDIIRLEQKVCETNSFVSALAKSFDVSYP